MPSKSPSASRRKALAKAKGRRRGESCANLLNDRPAKFLPPAAWIGRQKGNWVGWEVTGWALIALRLHIPPFPKAAPSASLPICPSQPADLPICRLAEKFADVLVSPFADLPFPCQVAWSHRRSGKPPRLFAWFARCPLRGLAQKNYPICAQPNPFGWDEGHKEGGRSDLPQNRAFKAARNKLAR